MEATISLGDQVRLALPQVSRNQAQEIAHSLLNPACRPITAAIISNVLNKQGIPGRMWKDLVEAEVLVPTEKTVGKAKVFEVATEQAARNAGNTQTGKTARAAKAAASPKLPQLRERLCSMDKRI